MHSCDIGIHICGLDLIATIEYQVTFRGYSGSYNEPLEPPLGVSSCLPPDHNALAVR
jgi:hypothetical protein